MEIVMVATTNGESKVRSDLCPGTVFRYLTSKAKPGLRLVVETPDGKEGLYAADLETGRLLVSKPGSASADEWPVEVLDVVLVVPDGREVTE